MQYSRRILWLVLTLAFAFGGVFSDKTTGIAQEEENIFPIETVVYVCHDGSDAEICVIRTDGRGFRQLTHNNSEDLFPKINASGQIAYQCGDKPVSQGPIYQICTINIDGSDQFVATDTEYGSFTPAINDSGLVAFNCPTSVVPRSAPGGEEQAEQQFSVFYGICTVQVDGSDFREVTTGQASDLVQPGRVNGSLPQMNNLGEIVFTCWLPTPETPWLFPHVCFVNASGEGLERLTSWPMDAFQPTINDDSIIAFSCIPQDDIPVHDRDICTMNSDGSDFHHLYNDIIFNDARPSMSNDGLIAYECPGGSRSRFGSEGICTVRVDGSERQLLANPFAGVQLPTNRNAPAPFLRPIILRAGAIIFECGADLEGEICLLYGSTNLVVLITDNETADHSPDF